MSAQDIISTLLIGLFLAGCSKSENSPEVKQTAKTVESTKEMNYEEFKKHCFIHLQTLSTSHTDAWGFGKGESWNADLQLGTLTWTFKDKKVTAPIQVICTYNTEKQSLLWGWDHPSVPKPLSKDANKLLEYGKKNNIEDLTTRIITCTEDEAWEYTAMAVKLANAQGAYRGPSGQTMVFFTFGEVKIEKL